MHDLNTLSTQIKIQQQCRIGETVRPVPRFRIRPAAPVVRSQGPVSKLIQIFRRAMPTSWRERARPQTTPPAALVASHEHHA